MKNLELVFIIGIILLISFLLISFYFFKKISRKKENEEHKEEFNLINIAIKFFFYAFVFLMLTVFLHKIVNSNSSVIFSAVIVMAVRMFSSKKENQKKFLKLFEK